MACRVLARHQLIFISMDFVSTNLTFKTDIKMLGDQLEILLSVYAWKEYVANNEVGHRPVIVKRALNGSKGGQKLSTIFLLKSVS